MFKEFKHFLLRGNVIDLAVGVIIGASFGAVVNALVSDLFTPLIGAIIKVPDFSNMIFTLNGSQFKYGHLINVVISFLLVATAVFFFVVKPVNMLTQRSKNQLPQTPPTKKCPECKSDIAFNATRCAFCTQLIK